MLGYIQSFFFVLVISISTVWLSHLGDSLDISVLLFGASLTACLFFNLIRWGKFYDNHMTILAFPSLWMAMSIAAMVCWWLAYVGTIYGSPRLYLALFFLSNAASGAFVQKNKWQLLSCVMAIFFIAYVSPSANVISVIAGVMAGICGFVYWKTSHEFAQKAKIQANDILAIRFYPLIIMSFIFLLIEHSSDLSCLMSWDIWGILILLGILNLVIPNYFSQSSVTRLGAVSFSQVVSTTPIVTFVFQGIFLHSWSGNMLIACIIVFLVLNYPGISAFLRKVSVAN